MGRARGGGYEPEEEQRPHRLRRLRGHEPEDAEEDDAERADDYRVRAKTFACVQQSEQHARRPAAHRRGTDDRYRVVADWTTETLEALRRSGRRNSTAGGR